MQKFGSDIYGSYMLFFYNVPALLILLAQAKYASGPGLSMRSRPADWPWPDALHAGTLPLPLGAQCPPLFVPWLAQQRAVSSDAASPRVSASTVAHVALARLRVGLMQRRTRATDPWRPTASVF